MNTEPCNGKFHAAGLMTNGGALNLWTHLFKSCPVEKGTHTANRVENNQNDPREPYKMI